MANWTDSELARHVILKMRNDGHPLVHSLGDFYRYAAGIWHPLDAVVLKQRMQDVHGPKRRVSRATMDAAVEVARVLLHDPSFFDRPKRGVPFANGFAAVENGEVRLEGLSEGARARFGYPTWPYTTTEPVEFQAFLSDVFADAPDAALKSQLVQEFLGACLLGIAPLFERALVLYGPAGRNGKSVLTAAISRLFDDAFRQAIPPQLWADQYHLSKLLTARINIMSEIPRTEIVEGAVLKAVISGDEVTARPIYKEPLRFRPVCGHIFACNLLPAVTDVGPAFWRRWLILEFLRVFEGNVLKDELIAKITSDLPALASWCVRGAARLLQRGNYEIPHSSTGAVDAWAEKADQVRAFLGERCVAGSSPTSVLYEAYRDWAQHAGHNKLSRTTFRERMSLLGHAAKRTAIGEFFDWEIK